MLTLNRTVWKTRLSLRISSLGEKLLDNENKMIASSKPVAKQRHSYSAEQHIIHVTTIPVMFFMLGGQSNSGFVL